MTKTNSFVFKAAVASIIGAAAIAAPAGNAMADEAAKGQCVGANACKGQGACKQVSKNDCAGKNGCKGKGFVEKTKAECDAAAKTDKKIHFVAK
jgi:hypothetical protein